MINLYRNDDDFQRERDLFEKHSVCLYLHSDVVTSRGWNPKLESLDKRQLHHFGNMSSAQTSQ